MKFVIDEEAKKVLHGLCDLALKSGGMQNKPIVDTIQANIEEIKEKED